mmetsp:Transcript_21586/g.63321  ORF Transcript_21586/g.63321 Transcript_21586/m.63321 type:complete len:229 (-) Transcript_21586:1311-1997(-)
MVIAAVATLGAMLPPLSLIGITFGIWPIGRTSQRIRIRRLRSAVLPGLFLPESHLACGQVLALRRHVLHAELHGQADHLLLVGVRLGHAEAMVHLVCAPSTCVAVIAATMGPGVICARFFSSHASHLFAQTRHGVSGIQTSPRMLLTTPMPVVKGTIPRILVPVGRQRGEGGAVGSNLLRGYGTATVASPVVNPFSIVSGCARAAVWTAAAAPVTMLLPSVVSVRIQC